MLGLDLQLLFDRKTISLFLSVLTFLSIFTFLPIAFADANGVNHEAYDIKSGIFGTDEGNGNFIFPNKLGINTTPTATLEIKSNSGENPLSIFSSASATLLVVNDSGNVGIGTTNPTYKLDVNSGIVRIRSGGFTYPLVLGEGPAFGVVQIGVTNDLLPDMVFGNNGGSELMRITNLGKVGIGTSAPQNTLDVEGGAAIGATYSGTNTASSNGLIVEGNVGIGTTTPSQKLVVVGDLNVTQNITIGSGTTFINGSHIGVGTSSPSAKLDVRGNVSLNNSLFVQESGNVGIGTSSPGASLHIVKSDGTGGTSSPVAGSVLFVSSSSANSPAVMGVEFRPTSSPVQLLFTAEPGGGGFGFIKTETPHPLKFGTGGGVRMTIDTSGNVGIGIIPTTGRKLEVNGIVRANVFVSTAFGSTGNNNQACYFTSGDETSIGSCASSIKYKENVKDLGLGLETVNKLRPVAFNWKSSGDRDLGFIAEEVEKINPILVTYENGEVLGVKYDQLTAVLVNAIKELKSENDALKQRVQALENK